MDEIRVFGYCECCGNEVTSEYEEYYVDSEGRVFCSVECILDTYGLTKVEV
jgi:hypothetical protein